VERLVVRSEKLFELSYSWFSTKPIVVGAIPKAIRVRRWNLEFYCNCFLFRIVVRDFSAKAIYSAQERNNSHLTLIVLKINNFYVQDRSQTNKSHGRPPPIF